MTPEVPADSKQSPHDSTPKAKAAAAVSAEPMATGVPGARRVRAAASGVTQPMSSNGGLIGGSTSSGIPRAAASLGLLPH